MGLPRWCRLPFVLLGALGCVPRLPIDGAPCPCPEDEGYVCRNETVCVRKGSFPDGPAAETPPPPPPDAAPDDGAASAAKVIAENVFGGELGGVVVDESGLYLAESRTLGRILHVPLEGGGGAPRTLASGQPVPAGLVADATHVYWTNAAEGSARPGAGALMKVVKGGGTPTTVAGGLLEPRGIAADATHVYFATWADGTIRRVDKQGGSLELIATDQKNPRTVAVDATHVYWGNFGAGDTTIRKAPKTGGPVVLLADAAGSPVELAVDGDRVYWLSYGTRAVRSVSKDGSAPAVLAPGSDGAGAAAGSHGLIVDATHVYWLDSFRISRVARTGGGGVTVVLAGNALAGFAATTSALYFGQGDDLLRVEKPAP